MPNARNADYYARNKKKCHEATRKWRYSSEANVAKKNASTAAWRAANPDYNKKRREAYALNPAPHRARANKRYAADPQKCQASHVKWLAENPLNGRINTQNRRARLRANGGRLSKGLAAKLFTLQKGMCPCCGLSLGLDYQMDHVMPIVLGGKNEDGNMQLLRRRCNGQKNAKHPVEFMQTRGFLL